MEGREGREAKVGGQQGWQKLSSLLHKVLHLGWGEGKRKVLHLFQLTVETESSEQTLAQTKDPTK